MNHFLMGLIAFLINIENVILHHRKLKFLHSHQRRYYIYVKFDSLIFHQISMLTLFRDPVTKKKRFLRRRCLFVCCIDVVIAVVCYTAIIFERIIGLNCAFAHFFRVKKERTSSLTSHFWPTVMVLSIKKDFT